MESHQADKIMLLVKAQNWWVWCRIAALTEINFKDDLHRYSLLTIKNTNFDKICDIRSCRCDGAMVGDSQDDSYHIHITKRLQTDWKMYPKILYLSNFSYIFVDACLYVGKSGRCNFMRSLSGIGIVGVTGVRLGNV